MKHIYLINNGSRAAQYGVGTHIVQLENVLSKNNDLKLTIVRVCANVEEFSIEMVNNVRYILIPNVAQDEEPFCYDRYCMNASYLLEEYIDIADSTIFHLHYFQDVMIVKALRERHIACAVCFTVHYLRWCLSLKGNRTYLQYILSREENEIVPKEKDVLDAFAVEKKLFDYVDEIICLSKSTREILLNEYNIPLVKLNYIANGLPDEVEPKENKTLRKELFLDEKEFVILFVGRLDNNKGIEALLIAFRMVLNKMQAVRLLIVGDGKYDPYLALCKGMWAKVSFVGRVGKEQLNDLYSIADLGVIASYTEQCSYVAIEMMMRKIPLIATSVDGVDEMVGSRYPYKINVPEDRICCVDAEELAKQMVRVLGLDRCGKETLGRLLYGRYRLMYGFLLFKDKMLNLYLNRL